MRKIPACKWQKPSFAFPFQIMPTACSKKAGRRKRVEDHTPPHHLVSHGRRERGEIACLVRILFVPKAMGNHIPGRDIFSRLPSTVSPLFSYRLPSTVLPPLGDLSPRPHAKTLHAPDMRYPPCISGCDVVYEEGLPRKRLRLAGIGEREPALLGRLQSRPGLPARS